MGNDMNVKIVRGISSFGPVWAVFEIGCDKPLMVTNTMHNVKSYILWHNCKAIAWENVTTDDMEV